MFESRADAAKVMTNAQKNKIAGSGILLPARSIKFKKRSIPLGFSDGALLIAWLLMVTPYVMLLP
jgi:hypothetical protein